MKRRHLPLLLAVGAGIAIGSFVTGSTAGLLALALILACPLMMIVMMGGMRHGADCADTYRHGSLDEPDQHQPRR